jgi:hypothetical protein
MRLKNTLLLAVFFVFWALSSFAATEGGSSLSSSSSLSLVDASLAQIRG